MRFEYKKIGITALAALIIVGAGGGAGAQTAPAKAGGSEARAPYTVSRANLAKSASFTLTQTLTPKDGKPLIRSYRIEVKGEKARMDYDDQMVGEVRYLSNEKGVFFYIPANKNAMKQTIKGGVDTALKLAFAQVSDRMATAKKVGTANVSGFPTTVYKDPKTGGMVYISEKPGFRLPVKTVLTNEGGSTMMEVKDIKLNVAIDDSRFALPPGTKIMESEKSASSGGLPTVR